MFAWLARLLQFSHAARIEQDPAAPLKKPLAGAIADLPDPRDASYAVSAAAILPKSASVVEYASSVKSQGAANSCVAHAAGLLYEIELRKKGYDFDVSEGQLYYDGRIESGLFPQDAGMYPRDVLKIMKGKGVIAEKLHSYNVLQLNAVPTALARSFQYFFRIKAYYNTATIEGVKTELADGHALMFDTPVYNTLRTAWQDVNLPPSNSRPSGRHEMTVIAYDDERDNLDGTKGAFLIQNSWDTTWGFRGRSWMPYSWFTTKLPGNMFPIVFYSMRI